MQNPNLPLSIDFLYHLGLSAPAKFVLMGGSPVRAEVLAKKISREFFDEFGVAEDSVKAIGKTERFSLFKVGPIISVSHGMGMPSLSILLHEISKLLYYSKVDLESCSFIRIGTSGGLSVPPGSVVIASETVDEEGNDFFTAIAAGKRIKRSAVGDPKLADEIYEVAKENKVLNVYRGVTMGTNGFYENQARMDGAICEITPEERDEYLKKMSEKYRVKNIEMESVQFVAHCKKLKIPAAIVCCTLLDRLDTVNRDQVTSTAEELGQFSENSQNVVLAYIKSQLKKD